MKQLQTQRLSGGVATSATLASAVVCALALATSTAQAVDVDKFLDAAKKPGGGAQGVVVDDSVRRANSESTDRVLDVRNERAEERRRAMAAAPPPTPSGGDKPGSAKPAAPAAKKFICSIYCLGPSGPRIEREFSGPDRDTVAREIGNNADSVCQGSGYNRASGKAFSASQCRAK